MWESHEQRGVGGGARGRKIRNMMIFHLFYKLFVEQINLIFPGNSLFISAICYFRWGGPGPLYILAEQRQTFN